MKLETTIREAIDNIRKNGYEQVIGSLVKYEYARTETGKEEIIAKKACAMGQLGLNMGLADHSLAFIEILMRRVTLPINKIPEEARWSEWENWGPEEISFTSYVEYLNDKRELTLEQIAANLEIVFADRLGEYVSIPVDKGVFAK